MPFLMGRLTLPYTALWTTAPGSCTLTGVSPPIIPFPPPIADTCPPWWPDWPSPYTAPWTTTPATRTLTGVPSPYYTFSSSICRYIPSLVGRLTLPLHSSVNHRACISDMDRSPPDAGCRKPIKLRVWPISGLNTFLYSWKAGCSDVCKSTDYLDRFEHFSYR